MFEEPLFLLGIALFFPSGLTFMVVLFANGGAPKSKQLSVLSDLVRGRRGRRRQRTTLGAMLGMALGTLLLFSGVAAHDLGRADRCVERCTREGYPTGRIGPSEARRPGQPRRALFVACRCEGGDRAPLELVANDL